MKNVRSAVLIVVSYCTLVVLSSSCAGPPRNGSFLSDTDPAYRALENEQKESAEQVALLRRRSTASNEHRKAIMRQYADHPPTSPFDVNIAEARPKRAIKLPTRFEDQLEYSILSEAHSRVTNAASLLGTQLPPQLRVGTLPTLTMNAEVVQFRGVSNKVVIINHKLFSAMQSLLISALDTIELSEEHNPTGIKIRTYIGTNELAQFQKRLLFLLDVELLDDPTYTKHVRLFSSMFTGVYCFIVAHEYGHLAHNDVPIESQPLLLWDRAGAHTEREAAEFVHSWQQELEADQFASLLLVADLTREAVQKLSNMVRNKTAGRYENEHLQMLALASSVTSPLLVFRCNQILEEALNIRENKLPLSPIDEIGLAKRFQAALDRETNEAASSALKTTLAELRAQLPTSIAQDSHPPSAVRHAFVEVRLQKMLGDPRVQRLHPAVKNALELGFMLDNNLGELWNQTKPILLDLLTRAREHKAKDVIPTAR